jgi:hypothetical protein
LNENSLEQSRKERPAMRATNDKEKEPASDIHQQALKSQLPPHTPKQQQQGKLSSAGAELQDKIRTASKKFVKIYQEFEDSVFELTSSRDTSFVEAYEQHQTNMWGEYLYCTPVPAVMFRLGMEWVKVTAENVAEAAKDIAEVQEVSPESYAKLALRDVRQWAKKARRFGWVLPKLETEVPQ